MGRLDLRDPDEDLTASRKVLRTCGVCGQPCLGQRCDLHAKEKESPRRRGAYDAEYERNRAIVLANALVCALCGQPERANDRFTANHIVPRARGGGNALTNLEAAHESCNKSAGARLPLANHGGEGSPLWTTRVAAVRALARETSTTPSVQA